MGQAEPVRFLFMDERYPDKHLPRKLHATTLTGLLVRAECHRELREGFYELLTQVVGDPPGTISAMPTVHASSLFPGSNDQTRFRFLGGLVDLIRSVQAQVYRIGYFEGSVKNAFGGNTEPTMGLLFSGLLHCLEDELNNGMIWPVMEIDRTPGQDAAFAGLMQSLDYFTNRLGSSNVSFDNCNFGEVLYTTKKSVSGAVVDCLAYLLHARTLMDWGVDVSSFKANLAGIAGGLAENIRFDEIIELQQCPPPSGYAGKGPIRYAYPITPSDVERCG